MNATPETATLEIIDSKGVVVFSGPSFSVVDLKASDGFFKKASYQLTVTAPGHNPVTTPINFKLDGWYFGNLLFGGFIGLLIVDPATGAMWKIQRDFIKIDLAPSNDAMGAAELKVMNINDIPADWKPHLEPLATGK